MTIFKTFVCARLTGDLACSYAVASDDEDYVVNCAAIHEMEEHGHEDTPEFREAIRVSLVDVAVPLPGVSIT